MPSLLAVMLVRRLNPNDATDLGLWLQRRALIAAPPSPGAVRALATLRAGGGFAWAALVEMVPVIEGVKT